MTKLFVVKTGVIWEKEDDSVITRAHFFHARDLAEAIDKAKAHGLGAFLRQHLDAEFTRPEAEKALWVARSPLSDSGREFLEINEVIVEDW